MESEDYPFFQGLVYLLENDVSTLGYELTFSTEVGVYSSCFVFFSVSWNLICSLKVRSSHRSAVKV